MMLVILFVVFLAGFFICFFAGYSLKCRWRDALIETYAKDLEEQRKWFVKKLEEFLNAYDECYQRYKKAVEEQRVKDRAVFEKSLAEISEMYDAQCRRCFSCHKNEQTEDERDAKE